MEALWCHILSRLIFTFPAVIRRCRVFRIYCVTTWMRFPFSARDTSCSTLGAMPTHGGTSGTWFLATAEQW